MVAGSPLHVHQHDRRAGARHHADAVAVARQRRHVVDDARARGERRRHDRGMAGVDRDRRARPRRARAPPGRCGAVSSSRRDGRGAGPGRFAADIENIGAGREQRAAHARRRCSGSAKAPPSEKLSGVTLTMPMTSGRSSARPAQGARGALSAASRACQFGRARRAARIAHSRSRGSGASAEAIAAVPSPRQQFDGGEGGPPPASGRASPADAARDAASPPEKSPSGTQPHCRVIRQRIERDRAGLESNFPLRGMEASLPQRERRASPALVRRQLRLLQCRHVPGAVACKALPIYRRNAVSAFPP